MICNVLMLTDYKKKTSAAKFQVTILFMMRMISEIIYANEKYILLLGMPSEQSNMI